MSDERREVAGRRGDIFPGRASLGSPGRATSWNGTARRPGIAVDFQSTPIEPLAGLPDATREQVLRILAILFPQRPFKSGEFSAKEPQASTAARRGVGYAPGYDAYFGLHPSSDAIPKVVVDGIVANLSDENALREAIEPYVEKHDWRGQPAIGQLLEELRYRFYGRGRPEPTQEFLDVLFEFGEGVFASDWKAEIFALSPRAQLSSLIGELLEAWGQEKAGEHLLKAFKKSNSAAFCANVFVERGRELGKFLDQSSRTPTVTEADFEALGQELLVKIERAASDRTLANAPFYFDIARAWAYMGKSAKAKAWLSDGMLTSPEFLSKVTLGMVQYTIGSRERSYSLSGRPEDMYDLEVILEATAKHRASRELNQDELNRISAVASGVKMIIERDRAEAAKTASKSEKAAEEEDAS